MNTINYNRIVNIVQGLVDGLGQREIARSEGVVPRTVSRYASRVGLGARKLLVEAFGGVLREGVPGDDIEDVHRRMRSYIRQAMNLYVPSGGSTVSPAMEMSLAAVPWSLSEFVDAALTTVANEGSPA